jgi:hypothetical protein
MTDSANKEDLSKLGSGDSQTYSLYLLEEIRLLQSSQLLILARIYDNLAGHNVDGAPDEGQTYKIAEADISDGLDRLKQAFAEQ